MKIHVHIVSYNEEKMLPYTLDYYSSFCEKIFVWDNMSTDSSDVIYAKYPKVEVVKWDSNNEINEMNYVNIKSNCYKERSRNNVDWVITCDCDEYVYHPDLINVLTRYKNEGVNIVQTSGHEMVSETFPEYDGGSLLDKVKVGSEKMPNLSKPLIFDPMIDVTFDVGAHHLFSNNPIYSNSDEIKILHYKFLGKEYVADIYKQRLERLSDLNKKRQWGVHYSEIEKVHSMMDEILNKQNIIIK